MREEDQKTVFKELFRAMVFTFLYIALVIQISPALIILSPIPFIIVGVRNGRFIGAVGMGIVAIVLGIITSSWTAFLALFIILVPITFILQYLISKKEEGIKVLALGTLVLLVSIVLSLGIEGKITGIDISQEIEKEFAEVFEGQMEALEELELDKYKMGDIEAALREGYKYMMAVVPSMFIIYCFFNIYIMYKLSSYILNRTGKALEVPDFFRFALPSNFLAGTLVMFLAVIVAEKMKLPYYEALSVNVSVLLAFLFLIQGLAILAYFFHSKGLKKPVRIILLLGLIVVLPLNGLFILLGFLDNIFDLRKIREKTL